MKQSSTITRAGLGSDARISTYELQYEIYTTVNNASTTETLVNAAKRLVDELPEGTPPGDVIKHWLASARADDAARGVIWPTITAQQMSDAGLAWHLFPNMSILQGITFALCYRARPYGDDPHKCIFESYAIERYPEGQEPKTEWVYAEPTAEKWGAVLAQDFSNMAAVQRGMSRVHSAVRSRIRIRSERSRISTAIWLGTWAPGRLACSSSGRGGRTRVA